MNKEMIVAAVVEIATGLVFFSVPSLVGWLVFGEEVSGTAIIVARWAAIAVFGLGIACWPGPPLAGMTAYNVLITLYLASLGLSGALTTVLLWLVVVFHAVLSVLLGRAWLQTRD